MPVFPAGSRKRTAAQGSRAAGVPGDAGQTPATLARAAANNAHLLILFLLRPRGCRELASWAVGSWLLGLETGIFNLKTAFFFFFFGEVTRESSS